MSSIKMYKVNTSKAYMASECGTCWMTGEPTNTDYYYHETLEVREVELPEGFEYDAERDMFFKNNTNYQLVNDDKGSVLLVSADGIVEWFK